MNGTRLRRGSYLIVLGVGLTGFGMTVGTEYFHGVKWLVYGPLLALAGVGFAGAAFVPTLTGVVGGEGATWEDLSLVRQLFVSAVIAVALFVLYLLGFWLAP